MFQTISMKQLEELLSGPRDFTLLDVRSREEYDICHLAGAVNIPLAQLRMQYGRIPKDRPVILYCSCGGKSLRATRMLSDMGYHAIDACGGLNYYRGRHLQKSFDRGAQSL